MLKRLCIVWALVWGLSSWAVSGQNLLPEGVPVLGGIFYANAPAVAVRSVVDVAGQPDFTQAMRVEVAQVSVNYFDVGEQFNTVADVALGQPLRLSLQARNVGSQVSARIWLKFQDPLRDGDGNVFSESSPLELTRDWQVHTYDFVAKAGLPAGAAQAVIFFGAQVQTVEVVDLRLEPRTVCELAPDDWLGRMNLANTNATDSATRMTEPGSGCFVRLSTLGGRQEFEPQLVAVWHDAVRMGDLLTGSLRLRRSPGSMAGRVQVVFQRMGEDYQPAVVEELEATEVWQTLRFTLRSPADFNGDSGIPAQLALNFGLASQTVDVADLRLEPAPEACELAAGDWLGRMNLANTNATDSATRMTEPGGGCFVRLSTLGGREAWRPQLLASFPETLQRGDILDCSLRLRRASGSAAGQVQVALQREDGSNASSQNLAASAEWQTHQFVLLARTDFNGTPGKRAQLALNFGFHGQTVEVAELRVTNLGRAHPDTPAHRVLAGFRRGMNLGNCLEYAECPPTRQLPRADFAAIRQEGFDHVRVPVAWHQGNGPAPGFAIAPCRWQHADWMVTNALAAGLGVVVDLHHFDEFNKTNPVVQRPRFVALWRQVAEHYAAMPTNVIFELLNEPFEFAGTDADLNQAYAVALATIRATGGANINRLVLLSPAEFKRGADGSYEPHHGKIIWMANRLRL